MFDSLPIREKGIHDKPSLNIALIFLEFSWQL